MWADDERPWELRDCAAPGSGQTFPPLSKTFCLTREWRLARRTPAIWIRLHRFSVTAKSRQQSETLFVLLKFDPSVEPTLQAAYFNSQNAVI
jgi:hypothetical protein